MSLCQSPYTAEIPKLVGATFNTMGQDAHMNVVCSEQVPHQIEIPEAGYVRPWLTSDRLTKDFVGEVRYLLSNSAFFGFLCTFESCSYLLCVTDPESKLLSVDRLGVGKAELHRRKHLALGAFQGNSQLRPQSSLFHSFRVALEFSIVGIG